MPHGEFRLHNTRTALVRPAAVFGTAGIIASLAGFRYGPGWYAIGAVGIALGAMYAVIGLCFPLTITLSAAGLTARGRGTAGVIPASAIEAVGMTKVGLVNYVTLWYDVAAVPSPPPAFGRYLRAMPSASPGRIHVGVINLPDESERVAELYRLVQETGLGEWRDYPQDPVA